MVNPLILVVGSTGTVGSEVVKQLVGAGQNVRALARDPDKAKKLGGAADIVFGDLARPETLSEAFAGAKRVFVLAPPVPNLEEIEAHAFAAAKRADAKHIVYLSNFGAGEFKGGIWQWHGASEKRLRETGVAWTILRPARFMPETPFPWFWDKAQRTLSEPTGGGRITFVDVRDIAAVAVKALTTTGHEGKAYELTTTEAPTGAEIAEKISKVIGKPARFTDTAPDVARQTMLNVGIPDFIADTVLHYFQTVGEGRWYVTSTVADVLGRPPRSLDAWFKENVQALS